MIFRVGSAAFHGAYGANGAAHHHYENVVESWRITPRAWTQAGGVVEKPPPAAV